ncbi:MAG: hypothetical protein FWC76_06865 [Defluviitaleaceae bacterium]|nr:hypothetical protein [Defluviitaleaceae bacterium]
MKKSIWVLIFAAVFLLAGCADGYVAAYDEDIYEAYIADEYEMEDEAHEAPLSEDEDPYEYEYKSEYERCECGLSYAHDVARPPTPPINIIDHVDDEFLEQFDRIHHFDFAEADIEWRNRIVFWTDEPLRDLSFITLGHTHMATRRYYYTREVPFAIDKLLPGEAFVLDVLFFHYLIPRGGLSFIDEAGQQQFMGIFESMAGICACWPHFHLFHFDDRTAVLFEDRVNGIYPTVAQHEIITELLGDYELGDIHVHQLEHYGHSVQFRLLHYDGRPTFYLPEERAFYARLETGFGQHTDDPDIALKLIEQGLVSRGFEPPEVFRTNKGDAILVHLEFFNDTLLMIDMGESRSGYSREYIIIELGG